MTSFLLRAALPRRRSRPSTRSSSPRSHLSRPNTAVGLGTLLAAMTLPLLTVPADALTDLPVREDLTSTAAVGFADWTRNGSERTLRNDLVGSLSGQVDFVQETTVAARENAVSERPDLVAERAALLLFRPTISDQVRAVQVQVLVNGSLRGTLSMASPRELPATDQTFDSRGTPAWSTRAWSAQLPWQWVRPGMNLRVTAATPRGKRSATLPMVDLAAPTELVVNNIQLGMLTTAPDKAGQRFLKDPANGASDYFGTVPIARLTMAQYEKVELDRVILASGEVLTGTSNYPDAGVYSGDLRENVGKAQVSTGINLATWGITSSPMNQSQPQVTNQRVIHHSAGSYLGARVEHGLSGGNGMATLYDSVGNELSHELGHSYGLGHFPGSDDSATGDDRVRNASHHMDSGWGWIAYRNRMRSNLATGAYTSSRTVNDSPFTESLLGRYNFNTDAMSSGWDASPLSDYTLHTGYSLKRIQNNLTSTTADTSYPSGYRVWRAGAWVDAKVADPAFNRPRPRSVGVPVFTLLGGYNPAAPEQTVLYPAFRSNYGVVFDLPQADAASTSTERSCWVKVSFADSAAEHITLGASAGVKQLNVNLATADRPTGAQIQCRAEGVTSDLGDPITIATDLPAMAPPVVVGQEQGYEALRSQELQALESPLSALSAASSITLTAGQQLALDSWSGDLSALSPTARGVAERWLTQRGDAQRLSTWLRQNNDRLDDGSTGASALLSTWLAERGMRDSGKRVLPPGTPVSVDRGKCLSYRVDTELVSATTAAGCTRTQAESWWVDTAGRIHPTLAPDRCLRQVTPVIAEPCSDDPKQRWVVRADGHVVSSTAPDTALDLYVSSMRPGLWAVGNSSNQIWTGFTTSPNPLLGTLDATGLSALFTAARPSVDIAVSGTAGQAGWQRSATTTAASRTALLDLDHAAEMQVGEGLWQAGTLPVSLPQGTTRVRARTLGDTSPGPTSRILRVDSVAPQVRASTEAGLITLRGTDATSGLASLQYRFGAGAWKTWRTPLAWPRHATVVEYRATDVAGNPSAEGTLQRPAQAKTPITVTVVSRGAIRVGKRPVVRVEVRRDDGTPWRGVASIVVRQGGTLLPARTVAVPASGKVRVKLPQKAVAGRFGVVVRTPATLVERAGRGVLKVAVTAR